MDEQPKHTPKIQHVEPPPIMLYSVTGERLDGIKEACSTVGQDLSFALASFSVGLTVLITYLTVPQLTNNQQTFCLVVMLICAVVFLYTGIRWFTSRNSAARIIDAIRRSDQPDSE